MPLSPSKVILYAANQTDFAIALAAAEAAGIPEENVTGDFYTAWERTAAASHLVLAVGAPALNALYYNPCGWHNPQGSPAGSTPFAISSSPRDSLPGANYFEKAAGFYASDTLYIATAFAAYAVKGRFPASFKNLPKLSNPSRHCLGKATNQCPCSQSVHCRNGLDAASDLSSQASCLWNHTPYSFVARYLGGPCYIYAQLTSSEAKTLSNAGFHIVSIYVGAHNTRSIQCGTQTQSQGQKDGQDAVKLAHNVGQPSGTAIYLDLEAGQLNSDYLGYTKAWADEVSRLGYRPAVYSSQAQLQTIHNQSWGGNRLLYWVAHYVYKGVRVPAPCPSNEWNHAQMWQYATGGTECGITVDYDSAEDFKGMWKL